MPLSAFTPQVREWFTRAFAEPTAAQSQAWPAIATGEHALISAPTGSGKTLAAFLWALDRLVAEPTGEDKRTRLVYVSPLKALSYDIEKNLRAPLRGHRRGHHGRHPHRRHAAEGAAGHGPPPARHPHHDARVAVPDAHEPGARDLPRHGVGDRRRDPRRRPDQARRAPRADAGAARRAGRARRPAHRAVRDPEPARGGRPLPRRPEAHLHGHRHRRAQAARPQDPRPGRVDGRARPGHERRRPRPVRGRRGDPQVDLARDLPRDPQLVRDHRSTIVFVNNRRGAERLALR